MEKNVIGGFSRNEKNQNNPFEKYDSFKVLNRKKDLKYKSIYFLWFIEICTIKYDNYIFS